MRACFCLVAVASALACAGTADRDGVRDETAFAAPADLRATLAAAGRIELRWIDRAAAEGGYAVEYTNEPEDPFVLVAVVPPDMTVFAHDDLAPGTRFLYRVRPFFGELSNVVEVETGDAEVAVPAATGTPRPTPSGGASLRGTATAAEASATGLSARLLTPTRAVLRWNDRSRDEEGFLIEVTADLARPFKVAAVVEPDVSSYVFANLPPRTRCFFRIRAFFYGTPSNVAEARTTRASS